MQVLLQQTGLPWVKVTHLRTHRDCTLYSVRSRNNGVTYAQDLVKHVGVVEVVLGGEVSPPFFQMAMH